MYLHILTRCPLRSSLVNHMVKDLEGRVACSTSVASTSTLNLWEVVPSLLQLATGKRQSQPSHAILHFFQGRSAEHLCLDHLNWDLDHSPCQVTQKKNCVVCLHIWQKQLPIERNRHESWIICTHCKVDLCVLEKRNCFQASHNLIQYWRRD